MIIMKRFYRNIYIFLVFALIIGLSACGGEVYGYKIIGTIGEEEFSLAFRAGDPISELVSAAISELVTEGKLAELSIKWLGGEDVGFEGKENALALAMEDLELESIEPREFILGIDEDAAPLSFADGEGYSGFDVELAAAVCNKLGWTLKVQPIYAGDVEIELASGDIDCAWGGLCILDVSESINILEPYFKADIVVAVRADSSIKRIKKLDGGAVCIRDTPALLAAFENSEDLQKLDITARTVSTSKTCFNVLDDDYCQAIIVSKLALGYTS